MDPAARRARLHEPHVAPIAALAARLRAVHGHDRVPDPDPCEAGVGARILLLMEAPGPKAAPVRGGSGLVSADNPSPTSRTLRELHALAGTDRARDVLTWNSVPWYVRDGRRLATPTKADRTAAAPATRPAIRAPHPSPQNLAARPQALDALLAALVQAREVAAG